MTLTRAEIVDIMAFWKLLSQHRRRELIRKEACEMLGMRAAPVFCDIDTHYNLMRWKMSPSQARKRLAIHFNRKLRDLL